jgi:hypothetical protein
LFELAPPAACNIILIPVAGIVLPTHDNIKFAALGPVKLGPGPAQPQAEGTELKRGLLPFNVKSDIEVIELDPDAEPYFNITIPWPPRVYPEAILPLL